MSANEKRNAERAISKYGLETCLEAVRLNEVEGEGQFAVSEYLDLHFNSAGAAINAGRWVQAQEKAAAVNDALQILDDLIGHIVPLTRGEGGR